MKFFLEFIVRFQSDDNDKSDNNNNDNNSDNNDNNNNKDTIASTVFNLRWLNFFLGVRGKVPE